MNKYTDPESEEENIMDIEEDADMPSSRKISNSIHNFTEIMSTPNSGMPSERFSGAYQPRRKNLLTETKNETNIKPTAKPANEKIVELKPPKISPILEKDR